MRSLGITFALLFIGSCHVGSADRVDAVPESVEANQMIVSDPAPEQATVPDPEPLPLPEPMVGPEPPPMTLEDIVLETPSCDPVDGEKSKITKADRLETRERIQAVCEELGASPIICAYYDLIVVRESSGRAGVRHSLGTRGQGENGLGALGLSLVWHKDKWPGKDEDPMFCSPEASAVVAHAIFWRAMKRYHAESIGDIQSIFGGFFTCTGEGSDRACFPSREYEDGSHLCNNMERRGFSCHTTISREDLGREIAFGQRRDFVDKMRRKFALSQQ
jgi:hypothetical protein